MTDNDLRGTILQKLYELRTGPRVRTGYVDFGTEVRPHVGRICAQLAESNLIEWKPIYTRGSAGSGIAKINAKGIDVVEGVTQSPVPVHIDQSHHYTGNHNIIGDGNVQISNLTIGQIAHAIVEAKATEEQKNEARSRIAKAFEHPAVKAVIGTLAESVTKGFLGSFTSK